MLAKILLALAVIVVPFLMAFGLVYGQTPTLNYTANSTTTNSVMSPSTSPVLPSGAPSTGFGY